MSRYLTVAAQLLGTTKHSTIAPLATWAETIRRTDETRAGVILTPTGRIVAHTHQDAAHTPRVDAEDVEALGLTRTAVDMTLGDITRAVGEEVRHIPISEVMMALPRQAAPQYGPEDQERLLARLHKHHGKVAEAEQAVREARAARRDAMVALEAAGLSRYRIARELGMSQNAVKKILG